MNHLAGRFIEKGIGILGLGRVGTVLAGFCVQGNLPLKALRDPDPGAVIRWQDRLGMVLPFDDDAFRTCGIVIFAVPDRAIDGSAREFLSNIHSPRDMILVHTSGIHRWDPDIVDQYKTVDFGVMHPLMAFPTNPSNVLSFNNIGFGLSGSEIVVDELTSLVKQLGGTPFLLPAGNLCLYHAGAVFAASFPVLLYRIAIELMLSAGLPESIIRDIAGGLMASVIHNISTSNPRDALSGPAVRKDLSTIAAHIAQLETSHPDYARIYRMLTKSLMDWMALSDERPTPDSSENLKS
ncbi:DUF2520 domain-containing protein [bacterium]|nr:DUF2520 domain-containing protein [candidate division CSSED10-310 bacterium]